MTIVQDIPDIFHQICLGFYRGVGAGLFNLFVLFGAIGEPAPTGLLKMVRNVSLSGFF